jgi:tetratricopeptide (TPR) repeat protein
MEIARFIFWTAMKTLALVFLGLLAVKSVESLSWGGERGRKGRAVAVRGMLYGAILLLAMLSAWNLGYDIAAEVYANASRSNLAHREVKEAYANALRAVELRPGTLSYWQALAASKSALRQFGSLVGDLRVFQALSGGNMDEEDRYRFASAYYFQGEFDKVIPLTQRMIAENRMYASPYVLQGYAYTAQTNFPQAERTFLEVLQMFPTQQLAVEGLAHLYFIGGNKAGALDILDQTKKFPFPPESRQRFEALKALYAQ